MSRLFSDEGGGIDRRGSLGKLMNFKVDQTTYLYHLLHVQAGLLRANEATIFLLSTGSAVELQKVAHIRPDEHSSEDLEGAAAEMERMVHTCIEHKKYGIIPLQDPGQQKVEGFGIVVLLCTEGKIVGGSCFIFLGRPAKEAGNILENLRVIGGYFEFYTATQK
jgi:hypothetical protein